MSNLLYNTIRRKLNGRTKKGKRKMGENEKKMMQVNKLGGSKMEDYVISICIEEPFSERKRVRSRITGSMFDCCKSDEVRKDILFKETKDAIKTFREAQ